MFGATTRTLPPSNRRQIRSRRSRSSSSSSRSQLQGSYIDNLSSRSSPNRIQDEDVIDFSALFKYTIAAITELYLFGKFFQTLDNFLIYTTDKILPSFGTWILFYTISLKSHIFNPLKKKKKKNRRRRQPNKNTNNRRTTSSSSSSSPVVFRDRIWIKLIPTLHATSSTIVVNRLRRYYDFTTLTLILHLACRDVWNTIHNTEKRGGVSVLANGITYLSAIYASLAYTMVHEVAGRLLGLTLVTLTVASIWIVQTWRMNGEMMIGGRKEGLLPMKRRGEESLTKLSIFGFEK